jgi:hypothetical protein
MKYPAAMNPFRVQEATVQFRGNRPKCQIKTEKWKVGASLLDSGAMGIQLAP